MRRQIYSLIVWLGLLGTQTLLAEDKKAPSDDYQEIVSSKFDFNETAINGSVKAPEGSFITGRKSSSMNQMVKLRTEFRKPMMHSRKGMKAYVK